MAFPSCRLWETERIRSEPGREANMKLALDTMISWIELINGKNGEKEK